MINTSLLTDRLGARFGLTLTATSVNGNLDQGMSLRVEDIPPPNGFRVNISHGWRSIEAIFVPDPFAAGLMKTLCNNEPQRRKEFSALAAAFASAGTRCVIRIDEKAIDSTSLPERNWIKFDLICSRLTDKSDAQKDFEEVGGACLALLLSLLPIEDDVIETDLMTQGLPEGALSRVMVNRYERRPANRAAAIAAHGLFCKTCGFDFAKFYGPIGEGFIEVHHRTPVSEMGENYVVNPVKDLVPLCANCHQMVHREHPAIEVDELRETLIKRGVISSELN